MIVKQKIKKRSVYHHSHSPFGHVARLAGQRGYKGKKPAKETGSYGRGTPRKGRSTINRFDPGTGPDGCGCHLVPRRGRGYAVSTMRTSS